MKWAVSISIIHRILLTRSDGGNPCSSTSTCIATNSQGECLTTTSITSTIIVSTSTVITTESSTPCDSTHTSPSSDFGYPPGSASVPSSTSASTFLSWSIPSSSASSTASSVSITTSGSASSPFYGPQPSVSNSDTPNPCIVWHGPPPALTAVSSGFTDTSSFYTFGTAASCETLTWTGSTHSGSINTNPAPPGTPIPPGTPSAPVTGGTSTATLVTTTAGIGYGSGSTPLATPDATSATFTGLGDKVGSSATGLLMVFIWPLFWL